MVEGNGLTATATGWGGTSEYSYETIIQRNLLYVQIPLIDLQVCNVNASYLVELLLHLSFLDHQLLPMCWLTRKRCN